MKKLLTILLVLVLSLSFVACGGGEKPQGGGENPPKEYTVEGTEGLNYSIYGQGDNRYAGFTGLSKNCTATDIVIASHYQGVKVTEIGNGMTALSNFKKVESVKVHKYITIINSSAFNKCDSLVTVDFEEECVLEKIGGSAFKNSPKLENFNYFGELKDLGEGAFIGCTALKTTVYEGAEYIGNSKNVYLILLKGTGAESVKVHKDCEAIHSSAFEEDTATKNITFESDENLTTIGGYAFKGSALEEITIPSSVKSIGIEAFMESANLKTVTFTKTSQCAVMGGSIFESCTALEEVVNFEYTKIDTTPEQMFRYCSSIKYINIPATVKLIKNKFMWGCTSNASITFAKDSQLVEFEMQIFRNNSKIKSIIIPKTVQKIGYNLLGWCHPSAVIYSEATLNATWHEEWNARYEGVYYPVYYYSETYKNGAWHYVNGEPTLW